MNKTEFIKALAAETTLAEKDCAIVNEILENHFIFSSKHTNEVISEIAEKLFVEQERAAEIYGIAKQLIKSGANDSLKHPLRSKED